MIYKQKYIIMNPYTNEKNSYPLTEKEIVLLDNVWNLINDFRTTELSRNKYRKEMINKVRDKYTPQDFFNLEKIIEKMYWNLVDKVKKSFDINMSIRQKKNFDLEQIKDKILKRNKKATESNVRKSYVYDEHINKLLYKYDYPNELDSIISSIMINRSVYETIMSDEIDINNIEIEPYSNNVEFDYAFPNLNTIKPFATSSNTRKELIENLYYNDDPEISWFTT
jgi:hypothetical protein